MMDWFEEHQERMFDTLCRQSSPRGLPDWLDSVRLAVSDDPGGRAGKIRDMLRWPLPLYYGSEDFCCLLRQAHNDFPIDEQQPPVSAEAPARGLLYFGGDFTWFRDLEDGHRIHALAWVFAEDRSTALMWWIETHLIPEPDGQQKLYWSCESTFRERTRWGEPHDLRMTKIVLAAVSLLEQRDIVEKEVVQKQIRNKGARRRLKGKQPSPVTVVDLRRSAASDSVLQAGERKFQHRWVVNGHWRNQACGVGRKDRRRIYVLPHIKGPEGAPMLETQKVYRW